MHRRFDKLNSTQDYLIDNIQSYADFNIISCKEQTAGYGRSGLWDGKKQNIYLSIVLPQASGDITELILSSLYQLFEQLRIKVRIKLPNDIYYKHQKLAGFIVNQVQERLVVGIGINIAKMNHPNWIGITEITSCDYEPIKLIEKLQKIIIDNYQKDKDFINEYFNHALDIRNQKINVLNRQTLKMEILEINWVQSGTLKTTTGDFKLMNYKFE